MPLCHEVFEGNIADTKTLVGLLDRLEINDEGLEPVVILDAHVFISVLAYHLLMWVRHHLQDGGDKRDWRTIRRLLSAHSLVSTILPLKDGRVLQIRKPSVPDAEQARVFQLLGIDWKGGVPSQKTMMKQ